MSNDQPPPAPKHVEPRYVFRDQTGYRRAIVVFFALTVAIGLAVLLVDLIMRLHYHPSLGSRDAGSQGGGQTAVSSNDNGLNAQSGLTLGATTSDQAGGNVALPPERVFRQPDRLLPSDATTLRDLSLTFDGLPIPEDLPALLSALEAFDVEATFFVDAKTMLQYGEALLELTLDNHTIGMLLSETEESLTSFVLGTDIIDNATQFMITGETGKRTLLVRAQTDATTPALDDQSETPYDATAQEGYLHVVSGIAVPNAALDADKFIDWLNETAGPEGAGVLRFDLMSDNSSLVINALPSILTELGSKGFDFKAIRLPYTPDEAMPVSAVASQDRDKATFGFLKFMLFGLTAVFLWMMIIAVLRSMAFLTLALWRGTRKAFNPQFQPAVTIIVPAYNEETVIERCISSLLQQEYGPIEIVVVDDGSTDKTAEVVREHFGSHPRVRLIMQKNHGKWSASNYALSVVSTPYFVIADADSLFLPDTVAWLVQQFQDERVGAVAGLVEVGNHENLLTSCQRIEYIVSQNIIRRAYEAFEGILVVPGAVGAWRTEAVFNAHEFSGDSITEDADLTIAVHRAGYRVRFQEQARSVTEAPANVRAFLRQRLRWTFGMLQVAWKHRRAISEGRSVGFISIVDSIVFGLVSSVVSPLVDLLLILILLQGAFGLATGGELTLAGFPTFVLFSYLALTVLDVINTLIAFRFERRFDLKLLLLVPFLRFGYRQLLYISTLRAIWQAISGRMAGWNKLDRSGADLGGSFRGSLSNARTTAGDTAKVGGGNQILKTEVPNR